MGSNYNSETRAKYMKIHSLTSNQHVFPNHQFSRSVVSNSLWAHGLKHVTNSQSLLKLMSIESVMPSNQSHPLSSSSPTFNLPQPQSLFQGVNSSHQGAKLLEFHLQHQSFQWTFGIDWFDLLAIQGTLKSLLQHRSSKVSILWHSAFFTV